MGQTGVVPDGARLGGAAAARQVGDALGGGVGAAGGGEADDVGVVVGARHVHLGHTVGGHGLARDGHVDGAALEGGDEGIPGGGNHLQLPAVGVTDALGDHHIIAVGIGPRHVGDGHRAVGVVHLGPVVGGIGALHAHREHAVLHAAGRCAGCGGGRGCGRGGALSGSAAGAAGGQSEGERGGEGQGGEGVSIHVCFLQSSFSALF